MRTKTIHLLSGTAVLLALALIVGLFLGGCQSPTGGDPVAGNETLAPGNEVPATGGEETVPGGEEPTTNGDETVTDGDDPVPGGEEPAPGGDEPAPGSEEPVTGDDEPAPGGKEPAPDSEEPAPGSEEPIPGGDEPAPGSEEPVTGGDEPAPGGEEPAPGGGFAAEISLWTNKDSEILSSGADLRISKSGANYPASFTAEVSGAYTGIQWTLGGLPAGSGTASITINAADYPAKNYILGVIVFKDGIPYSNEIRFTVVN